MYISQDRIETVAGIGPKLSMRILDSAQTYSVAVSDDGDDGARWETISAQSPEVAALVAARQASEMGYTADHVGVYPGGHCGVWEPCKVLWSGSVRFDWVAKTVTLHHEVDAS